IEQIATDRIIESLNQSDLSEDLEIYYSNGFGQSNNENNESESGDVDEPKIIVTSEYALKAVDTLIEYLSIKMI
ncbi:6604_t:CDS:2, partial [Entrophospora sp. SA101]